MKYKITYELIKDGTVFKDGVYIVKNAPSSLVAQVRLETFLRKKYTFDRMVVINVIELNAMNDFFSMFGNSNPFK